MDEKIGTIYTCSYLKTLNSDTAQGLRWE